ncbi:hypothetical protein [Longimicrobium sp.]|uniref:hypothetical protein n=1 Tax=Longimicrobium sp. TaxID=2029185 RepID=UPI002BF5B1E7|nr:hypothetical protein [Longimicrobium sp.]HSU13037.1 hypothetical protein [Longimicrobium sp.]
MSKLTQIENALLTLEGGRFHQLCDAYLHCRGYEGINSLGRVLGSDKVAKGTPDTWIAQPNGRFIFAEYTTQVSNVERKLRSDFAKCIDEAKTGVPIGKIQEVIFCYTGRLAPAEASALLEEAVAHNVLLTLIGIGPLAYALYLQYPGLALEYLGVEVDTGQIIPPSAFVASYGRNALTTPLDTVFHGRESEIADFLEKIGSNNVILIAGKSGVGKTRFALEAIQQFCERNPKWRACCILNRGRDLFNDLRIHFPVGKKFLVLVDDANRLTNFNHVLQLLHEPLRANSFKVVATVRDYALSSVNELTRVYRGVTELEVDPLSDNEIEFIVREHFTITNSYFLNRIVEVARGNPRLALMAAQVAAREKNIESLADVTTLYEEYYATVRQDLIALNDPLILRVAAVIAVFRTIDKENSEQMGLIEDTFGIRSNVFWEAAREMHKLELVDMYESEVIKISDQVLATYLFYLGFFKGTGVFDVNVLFEAFFPRLRRRLLDAIYAASTVFDGELIRARLRNPVEKTISRARAINDERAFLLAVDTFWFVVPTDALLAVQERVESMLTEPRDQPLNFDYKRTSPSVAEGSVLHILGKFRYSGDLLRPALQMLLDYAVKHPSDLPHITGYLVQRYGFRHVSHWEGFEVESTVVDVLIDTIASSRDDLVIRVFFAVAKEFLKTHFSSTETTRDDSLAVWRFNLADAPDVVVLRRKIWSELFRLADTEYFPDVLGVLHSYATSTADITVRNIVEADANLLLPFISSRLQPADFDHCVFVQDYLDLLRLRRVSYPRGLRSRFKNDLFKLAQLLNPSWEMRAKVGISAYSTWHYSRVHRFFRRYSAADYTSFFVNVGVLLQKVTTDHARGQLEIGVESVLRELAERDSQLYLSVIGEYVAMGNSLNLRGYSVPATLIATAGEAAAYSTLTEHEYNLRRQWVFQYYVALPAHLASRAHVEGLCSLHRVGEIHDFPYDLRYLFKYAAVDPDVFRRVVSIVLERAENGDHVTGFFESLFSLGRESDIDLLQLFNADPDLLTRAYLWMQIGGQYSDHDGSAFNLLLTHDPDFGTKYVDWVFEHHSGRDKWDAPDPGRDHRNYDVIWRRDDYRRIMKGIIRKIYDLEATRIAFRSYLRVFFAVRAPIPDGAEGSSDAIVRERQDEFLTALVLDSPTDIDFLAWVFTTTVHFSPERKYRLLEAFLTKNRNVHDFRRLAIDSKSWAGRGSFVPDIHRRIDILMSFLPLFNAPDLLRHRKIVEAEIAEYRRWMELEMKRDFMRD